MVLHLRKYEELTADELIDWGGGYQTDSGGGSYSDSSGSDGYRTSSSDDTSDVDGDDDSLEKGDDVYHALSGDEDDGASDGFFDQGDFAGDIEGYAYSCYAVSTINAFQAASGENLSNGEAVEILEEAERRGYYDSKTGSTSNQAGLWRMHGERSNKVDGERSHVNDNISSESEFREAVSGDHKAATVVFDVPDAQWTHSVSLHGDSLSDIEDPFYGDGKFDYDDIVEVRFFD